MTNNRQNPYLHDMLEDRAVVFKPKEGEVLTAKGTTITLKVTSSLSNDQLGIYEIALEPQTVGARLHYHRFTDETFIVKKGTLAIKHGTSEVEAEAGSVIYIPSFTPHGFANNSEKPVDVTLILNPAQAEAKDERRTQMDRRRLSTMMTSAIWIKSELTILRPASPADYHVAWTETLPFSASPPQFLPGSDFC